MRLTMLALAILPTAVDDGFDPLHQPAPEPDPEPDGRHPNPKDEPMSLSEADVAKIEAADAKRQRRRARNLATMR